MQPLVSILIPAYNAEQFIAQTLQSALAQTWERKEIIVVDDGSTDGTLAIARQFASASVQVVTQPNQGAAVARNRAFSLCQGDFIQWLDADDLLSADKIAGQMAVLEQSSETHTLASGPWAYFMYRPSRAQFIPTSLWEDLAPLEWLLRKWEGNLHMQTATWLVSRRLTESAGPWNSRLLGDDDGEYFFRVVRASGGTRFVPQSKVFYRVGGSSRLSYIGRSNRKMEAQLLGMKLQIGYLLAMEDSARVRAACIKYLQTWLPEFYPNCSDFVRQAEELAAQLGGHLEEPRMSWKYAWIQRLFGLNAARKIQIEYNCYKTSMLRMTDRVLSRFDRPNAMSGVE